MPRTSQNKKIGSLGADVVTNSNTALTLDNRAADVRTYRERYRSIRFGDQLTLPTLIEFFEQSYLQHAVATSKTWSREEKMFRRRVAAHLGHHRLDTLDWEVATAFVLDLKRVFSRDSTVECYVAFVGKILGRAVEWGVLRVNVFAAFMQREEMNRIELGQTLATFDKAQSNRNAFVLMQSTGACFHEVFTARWSQFDRRNGLWRIPARTSRTKRLRNVRLNSVAIDAISALGTEGTFEHLFVLDTTGNAVDINGRKPSSSAAAYVGRVEERQDGYLYVVR